MRPTRTTPPLARLSALLLTAGMLATPARAAAPGPEPGASARAAAPAPARAAQDAMTVYLVSPDLAISAATQTVDFFVEDPGWTGINKSSLQVTLNGAALTGWTWQDGDVDGGQVMNAQVRRSVTFPAGTSALRIRVCSVDGVTCSDDTFQITYTPVQGQAPTVSWSEPQQGVEPGRSYSAQYTVTNHTAEPRTLCVSFGVDPGSAPASTVVSSVSSAYCAPFGAHQASTQWMGYSTATPGAAGATALPYAYVYDQGATGLNAKASFTAAMVPLTVSLEPYHPGIRVFESGHAYTTPAYTSMDAPRAVTLAYSQETANPRGFVAVDATDHYGTASTFSIRVQDAATGAWVTSETFYQAGPGANRLAAQWDAASIPTDVRDYRVAVTVYRTDGSSSQQVLTVPVLLVNTRSGPYGAGWGVVGHEYLHLDDSGALLLVEGGTRAVRFAPPTCGGCDYVAPEGEFSRVRYDGSGYVRTHPDGTRSVFDGSGRLAYSQDRFGNRTSFGYDGSGGLAYVQDPVGHRLTFGYAWFGKLAAITDPAGRQSSFTVGTDGRLTQVTAPDGGIALTATYSGSYLVSQGDRSGATSTISYDAAGMVAQVTAPSISPGGPQPVTRRRSWELALLAPPGTGASWAPAPRVDPAAVRAEVTDARGNTVRSTFNRFGQPLRREDEMGGVTTWTYDRLGRPDEVREPRGRRVKYAYNDGPNYLASHAGPVDVFEYTQGSGGEFMSNRLTYEYEPTFALVTRVSDLFTGRLFFYSGPSMQMDSTSNGTATTRYTYETRADGSVTGRVATATDPEGHVTTTTYDPAGFRNTASVAQSPYAATRFGYDGAGRAVSVTDPENRTVLTAYDAVNRVTSITGPDNAVVRYGYDDAQRVYTVTDPRSLVHTTRKNALGWTVSRTDSRGGTESYAYDVSGQVTQYTNRRGQVVQTQYDQYGRIASQSRPADGQTTTWSYGPGATPLWAAMQNGESTDTTYLHPSGLPRLKVSRRGTLRFARPFVYDTRNRLVGDSLQGPWGVRARAWRYTDAVGGFVDGVTVGGGRATLGFNHDRLAKQLFLPPFTATVAGSIETARNSLHRPSTVRWQVKDGTTSRETLDLVGQHDALGRLTRTEELHSAYNPPYDDYREVGYTTAGRVAGFQDVRVTYPTENDEVYTTLRSGTYTYDPNGNRTDSGASIEWNSNRLLGFGGYVLEYDADGNLTRKYRPDGSFDQRFTWNVLGQLTQVSGNGSTVTFGYDGAGRRVRKTVNGSTTRYFMDGGEVALETDVYGNVLREYGYMPGVDHPYVVRLGAAGTPYYYLADGQGNISRLVNGSGSLVQSFVYDPWGRVIAGSGTSIDQPLRENGRFMDAETGLYFNRARYYDPELGRFISEDPAGFNGGLNPYAFALSDPVNFRDPSGMGPCVRDWVFEGSVRDANEEDGVVNPLVGREVWDCSGWLDWYEAWQSMEELVDWATRKMGHVLGTEHGDAAVEVWAERYNDAEGVGKIVPAVMGSFASLWTTDTWAETAITLGTAGLGAAGSASGAAPRVFWSGGGPGGVAHQAATAYATATGGVTLEMTAIGRGLSRLDKVLPKSVSGPLWRAASWNFARGAQGTVHAFHAATGLRINAFWATEYRQLVSKGVDIVFHVF